MSLQKRRQSSRLNRGTLPIAIENGNISDVEAFLLRGTPVGTGYMLNRTALHIATSTGNEAIIDLLLRHNAQVTDLDKHKNTPLHFAAESGKVKVFKKLLQAPAKNGGPANINAKNSELETPLHSAAFMGHDNLIKYMIKRGAEVDSRKKDSGTPLHLAAATGNPKTVKTLLKSGADVNVKTVNGSTPLHCAVFDVSYDKKEIFFDNVCKTKLNYVKLIKQDEVVSMLLKAGANPNIRNTEFKSPLHYTVKRNHLGLMQRLLHSGAQVDLLDHSGRSALHHAAKRCSPEMIRILLDSGANVNLMSSMSSSGGTPLHYAVSGRNLKVISMLICAGADISIKTGEGYPLHFFIHSDRDAALLHLLLECGADINAQDKNGFTFIHHRNGIFDSNNIVAILMELFIDFNIVNGNRKTALECALDSRYFDPDRPIPLITMLAKMESDGKLKINRRDKQTISDCFSEYYQQCKEELENLKKRKVWGYTSFYDLLSKSINELAVYIRNEELLEVLDSGACEEFKIYGNFMEIRMRMALARKKILDSCLEVLTKLLSPKQGPKLPRFFGFDVLNYLNAVDLENLSVIKKV